VDLYTLLLEKNRGALPVENNNILTQLFNARKASFASGVPSFCSNIRANSARIDIQTDVTQAYLAY
jgi:hypothetical protein